MKYLHMLVALAFLLGACQEKTKVEEKPNVLLITIDDLNDWIGAFGGNPQAITPNIDGLANKGIAFTKAYCTASLCNPSRTSFMTGLRPTTTGVYDNVIVFRKQEGFADVVTLPQYFAANGYHTEAAGKIYHSWRGDKEEPHHHSDPGSFQVERIGRVGASHPPVEKKWQTGLDYAIGYFNGGYVWKAFDWAPTEQKKEDTQDWQNADYCADFLAQEHDRPFFLACGIFRPHLPWYAPKEFFDLYDVDSIKLPEAIENDLDDVGEYAAGILENRLHHKLVELGLQQEATKAYLANTSFADACVGHVLQALENSPYADNTIVVLLGDHGWHLGEKTHWTKETLWEEAARAPLIVYDPRSKNTNNCDRVVSFLDIYPTLVELCELPAKQDIEGISFSRLVKSTDVEWDRIAFTVNGEGNHSLRSERYRYTRYHDGFEELYDHLNDPMEFDNVAKDEANGEIMEHFRAYLDKLL